MQHIEPLPVFLFPIKLVLMVHRHDLRTAYQVTLTHGPAPTSVTVLWLLYDCVADGLGRRKSKKLSAKLLCVDGCVINAKRADDLK